MDKSGWGLLGEIDDSEGIKLPGIFLPAHHGRELSIAPRRETHAMQARVVNPAAMQALGLVAGQAKREGYVMAVGDAFWIIVVHLIFSLAAAPLLEKPRRTVGSVEAH